MHVKKIPTLNINGITAPTRLGIISEFIKSHELDIFSLHEVTNPDTLNFRGYEVLHNTGTSMRGTAIIVRNAMPEKVAVCDGASLGSEPR